MRFRVDETQDKCTSVLGKLLARLIAYFLLYYCRLTAQEGGCVVANLLCEDYGRYRGRYCESTY